MMQNYAKSMADINQTLRSGAAPFRRAVGHGRDHEEYRQASSWRCEAWQQVLDIYPMMRSAQNEVATLSEELAGEGI